MSELKTIYAEDTFDEDYMEYHHSDKRYYREVYLKSEADKVIARQKYKRCLAMARWCDEMMMSLELRGCTVHPMFAIRHKWAMRWKYRWLELAQTLKEAK